MKNIKLVFALTLVMMICSIILVGCGEKQAIAKKIAADATAHDHSYNLWEADEENHYQVCSEGNCEEEVNRGPHNFDNGTVLAVADSEKNGLKVYTCTTCGYKLYVYFPIEKTETIQKTATISFEANGGSPVAPITANVGSKIEEPTTTLEGKVFAGWYTSQDEGATLDEKFVFSYMPSDGALLYAKWEDRVLEGNTYQVVDVYFDWVPEEKDALVTYLCSVWEVSTEEELLEIEKEYVGKLVLSYIIDSNILIAFNMPGSAEPMQLYYTIDDENNFHFYENYTDYKNGTEADMGLLSMSRTSYNETVFIEVLIDNKYKSKLVIELEAK